MPRMNVKTPAPRPQASSTPRYSPRFINGIHTVFDRVNFGHGPGLRTAKDAVRVAGELNEGKLQWRA